MLRMCKRHRVWSTSFFQHMRSHICEYIWHPATSLYSRVHNGVRVRVHAKIKSLVIVLALRLKRYSKHTVHTPYKI